MSVVDIAFLFIAAPLVLILSLHSVYLVESGRARKEPAPSVRSERSLSIVIPIKNEPIDLVCDSVEHLSGSLKKFRNRVRVYLISDDEEGYVEALRGRLSSLDPLVPVEIVRRGGKGGRVGALNFALSEIVKSDTLVVLDIDARPSDGFFEELLSCTQAYSACVGHWVGYWIRDTRIARALAFSTELVATALYKGRQALGLLVFPLGSGTIFNAGSLRTVGGWEDGTIQDDVIIGMKLYGSGYRVGYSDEAVLRVLVPSSYRAFRIQQLKWAYGSLESLRYSFRYLDKKVGFLRSTEARLYTLQYIPGLSVLAASIVVPSLAIAANSDLGYYSILAVGIASSFYVMAVLKTFGNPRMRSTRLLKLLGTVSAIGFTVAPVIIKGMILGALGLRLRAPVTPKGPEDHERYQEYVEEYVAAAISSLLGIAALVKGYYVASGLGFLPTVALVYTLVRATRRPNSDAPATTGRPSASEDASLPVGHNR